LPLDIVPSVCPHDRPSACALEVERIEGNRIGRIHEAHSQTYTAGVVCAKVARYAERLHHPDRRATPLRRVGDKGVGRAAFAPISWDAALDEVAEGLTRAAERHDPQAVWPYYSDDGDPERLFRLVTAPLRSFLNTSFNNPVGHRPRRPLDRADPSGSLGPARDRRWRPRADRQCDGQCHRPCSFLRRVAAPGRRCRGNMAQPCLRGGMGINLLTSADPRLPHGGAVFHDISVWLRPA